MAHIQIDRKARVIYGLYVCLESQRSYIMVFGFHIYTLIFTVIVVW